MEALEQIILFSFLMIAYVSCRVIVIRKGNTHLWDEYKSFFNKDYQDHEEELRKAIWESIVSDIFHHNARFHLGNESYHIGLNEFSDMAHEDFQNQVTGLVSEINCNDRSMIYQPPAIAYIPAYLNWYERGYVTEVLNQGKCGACWAFCSVASLEGQHKRMTGKLVKLSEQNLIDCSHSAGNKGCKGGQMCRAFEYATDAGGVDTEESYPFARETGTCKFSPSNVGAKVGGYLEIPIGDEDALLKALVLIGPIAAGVDGSQQTFRHYKGGIYDDENCNNKTLNHAVTIIGYGTEAGKDYWLIKNSWGKSWGENGFGKLVRNKNNQCGLASKALFPVLYQDDEGTPLLNGPKALTVN